ncbi:uncharacterized protein LOC117650553 [Thrips palmi]|uniref:Uncharacterized protein LOC117650553 n=1 Tax=Thrips palmi TaxID=161013 RepID=A0A6P8ZXU7_THRPL|nr:uncharacterized protein LOC117650553 [Thrips palmi]
MSKMSFLVVVAVAACLVAEALSACPSRQLNSLETQIEICSRNVPVPYRGSGSWQWARYVSGKMAKEPTCNLDNAAGYLQGNLEGRGYIGKDDIDRAVNCLKTSISSGICC